MKKYLLTLLVSTMAVKAIAHEEKTEERGPVTAGLVGDVQSYVPDYPQCMPPSSPATVEEIEISKDCELLLAISKKRWQILRQDVDKEAFDKHDYFSFSGAPQKLNTKDQYIKLNGIRHIKGTGGKPSRQLFRMHPQLIPKNGMVMLFSGFFVDDESHTHFSTYEFRRKLSNGIYEFEYKVDPALIGALRGDGQSLPVDQQTHRESGGGTGQN